MESIISCCRTSDEVLENSLIEKEPRNIGKVERAPKNVINKLNHYCLVKIFTYVPYEDKMEMEKVCQKWKEAVKPSWSSVKKIVIYDKHWDRNYDESKLLENCCQYLTHLTLYDPPLDLLEIIKNKCQNIIHFELYADNDEINEKILHIISSMSKLKHLQVLMLDVDHGMSDPVARRLELVFRSPSPVGNIILEIYNSRYIHYTLAENSKSLGYLTIQRFPFDDDITGETLKRQKLKEFVLAYRKDPKKTSFELSLPDLRCLELHEFSDPRPF